MADSITIWEKASNLDISPQFSSYSRVTIHVSDDSIVTAGNDTGRTLEITNPFGTQKMCESILAKLKGFRYQPYEADGAILDPAAEIGDAVTVGSVYGGIYSRNTNFSRLMASNISAPKDEEIDHEYKFESPAERKFARDIGDMQATMKLQSDQIEAKVSQENSSTSFGWKLLSYRWSILANGQEVFSVDKNGGTFAGKVVASSGKIGGFDITATAIYSNISSFNGTQETGVYIGTDGIQLGQGFKVDSSGNMTCTNATVSGTIRAGDIRAGGEYGSLPQGSVGSYQLDSYASGGVGGGYSFNKATKSDSGSYPSYFQASSLVSSNRLTASSEFYFQKLPVGWVTKTITPGTTYTIKYLGSY